MGQDPPDKSSKNPEPVVSAPSDYLLKAVREVIAISFWVYVLLKLFVFDLDVFLTAKFLPEYERGPRRFGQCATW